MRTETGFKILRRGRTHTRIKYSDGTTLLVETASLERSMPLSVILTKIKRFNEKYFYGRLPEIKVSFNNRTRSLGFFRFSRHFGADPSLTEIQFSRSLLDYSSEIQDDVILHEMIHAYQYFVLESHDGHGSSFKREMRRINADGHNIATTFSEVNYTEEAFFYVVHSKFKTKETLKFASEIPSERSVNQTIYSVPKKYIACCRGFSRTMQVVRAYGNLC